MYHKAVNIFDLFVILNNWGTDDAGADLAEDYEIVDVFDLFVVLDSWGGCVGAVPDETATLEDVLTAASLTTEDWDDFVEVLTESEDEDQIENYLCWMKNMLTECVFCPPCPDENPFR